jgi:holo-[acyl-carrier protein] synthase
MIIGTGIDIEEVSRIRGAIERHGRRFIERIFTPAEAAYAERAANRYERYAARFAAKEAGMKALGTGWDHGVRWVDVEVVSKPRSRPSLLFHGRAADRAASLTCRSISLSLSHTRGVAIAQVILES